MARKSQDGIRVGVLSETGNFILNTTSDDKIKIIGGYEARFLNMLIDGLQSHPIIHTLEKDEWGKPTEDGDWTGLIGMVHRQEVDMAVSSVLITQARMEVVDFSYPYSIEDVTFATRLPGSVPTATALIDPFSTAVWLGLAASLLVFPVVARIMLAKKQSLGKSMLSFFGYILNQPLGGKTDHIKDRILLGAWLCGTMFLSKTYSSYLLSFITLPIRETPIKDVNQLSKAVVSGTFKCYTTRESSILESLFSSLQENSVIIAKAMKENDWLLESDNSQFVKYALEQNSAIIRTRRYIHNLLQDNVFVSDDSFYAGYAAIVLPKNSPLKLRINKLLNRIDSSGVYPKFSEHYLFQKHLQKNLHRETENNEIKSISLEDIEGAFLLLISGYLLAIAVFFLEIAWRKMREKDYVIRSWNTADF